MIHESAEGEYVNHPRHYNTHPSEIEAIELIRLLDSDCAAAVKYVWRMWDKFDAKEDVGKALWYLRDELADELATTRVAHPSALAIAEAFAAAEPNPLVAQMVLAVTYSQVSAVPADKVNLLCEAIQHCEALAASLEAVPAAG